MSLTGLSTEVLLWILVHLQPEDAINFGKTCKMFRKINKDKVLWKHLTYRICLANGILIPHDLNKMSLKELMHTATAPNRVLKLLHSNRQPLKKSDDSYKYILPKRVSKLFSPNDSLFKQMFLVPGGRYMLTLAADDVFYFWDLRASSKKHPVYLKQWSHPWDCSVIMTIVPTSDQKGLRMVVGSKTNTSVTTVYELIFGNNGEVDLTTTSAPLQDKIITEDGDYGFCVLIGNRLAHLCGSVISIWDYKHDKFTRWDCGINSYDDDVYIRDITIDGDRLWILYNFKLAGWIIPQLRDREANLSDKLAGIVAPEFSITIQNPSESPQLDESLDEDESSWMSSQDWYSNLDSPLDSFDIIWSLDGNDKVSTYSISDIYREKPTIDSIRPLYTMDIPVSTAFAMSPRETIDCMTRCGDYLIKPLYSFLDSWTLHLIVSPRLGLGKHGLKSFRAALALDAESITEQGDIKYVGEMDDWMSSHLFDPVGGRACMIQAGQSPVILVCDYLDF